MDSYWSKRFCSAFSRTDSFHLQIRGSKYRHLLYSGSIKDIGNVLLMSSKLCMSPKGNFSQKGKTLIITFSSASLKETYVLMFSMHCKTT